MNILRTISGIAPILAGKARAGIAAFLFAAISLNATGVTTADDETASEPASVAENAVEIKAYGVKDVPNVHLTDATDYVSDPAGLLGPAAKDTINLMIKLLEDSTRIKLAVVMLPSIGEADIFDFAQELFNDWGIGNDGNNSGLLILYVEDSHSLRFHVGYGLEGVMTDAVCKQIQTRAMIPRFREGDTDGGMKAGVGNAVTVIRDGELPEFEDEDISPWWALAILGGLASLIGIPTLAYKYRKCPSCHKRGTLHSVGEKTIKKGDKTYWHKDYECKACGHTYSKEFEVVDTSDGNGAGGSTSFGTGRSSGGGGVGGSWGGGLSGGGGATSRW